MRDSETIYFTFGFLLAAVAYIALLAVALRRGPDPGRLLFAGLLTLVAATWFGSLPRLNGFSARGIEVPAGFAGDAVSQASGAMTRVGVVLVLAGLGLLVWRSLSKDEAVKHKETAQ